MSVTLLSIVVLLLTVSCVVQSEVVEHKEWFDYIVVGLGAAGCVTASRLAEHGYRVLGIEAGPRTQRSLNGTDYVAASFYTLPNGKIKYGIPFTRFDVPAFYPTTSQPPYKDYLAIKDGVSFKSDAGRLLGGSGAHNGMIFSRFTPGNFASWGVEGWTFEDVLTFYKSIENVNGTSQAGYYPAYHGFTGPIKISDPPVTGNFQIITDFIAACENYGLPANPDFNGPNRVGCGYQVFNIRRGVRDSSANALLSFAARRGNLFLELEATASKILFKREFGHLYAHGVEFIRKGVTYKAYARKEIVLSLGALNTPRLLQISGIGPTALLESLGIPVLVHNDNVGKNLINNQKVAGAWSYGAAIPSSFRVYSDADEYALNGTGLWASPPNFGFGYTCSTPGVCTDPDVYVATQYGTTIPPGLTSADIATSVETTKPVVRGVVSITSTNIFDPINFSMPVFTPTDLNVTIFGLQLLRKIINTYPNNLTFAREILPGPTVQTYEDYVNYVTTNGGFAGHWAGTCRVGNYSDPLAVVDPKLRVVGVKHLRVADASIFVKGAAHTHCTALMVGERAAHLILEDA